MIRLLASSLVLASLLAACSSSESGETAGTGGVGAGAGGSGPGGASAGGASAGTSSTGGAAGSAVVDDELPCKVRELLASRCQQCHSEPTVYGAPMPLVRRTDLVKLALTDPSTTVGAKAVERMKDDKNPMPQPPNPRATQAEIDTLTAWVSAGMPVTHDSCSGQGGAAGSTSAGGGGTGNTAGTGTAGTGTAGTGAAGTGAGGSPPVGGTCVPDQIVRASKPWTIKQDAVDQYVCFGGSIPASTSKRQITEVYVDIDNKSHAHHLCIYDMGTKAVSTEPKTCSAGSAALSGKLLYCWAPGADAETLPAAAGFPLEAGVATNILIEMHYSNIQAAPESVDNSGATFCTTDQLRPNDADVMAFGSPSFSLPPHQKTTVQSTWTVPNGIFPNGEVKLIRGWPHMHLLGVGQNTIAMRGDTMVGDLGSTSTYSFQNQISYPLDITLKTGDTITTKCLFDNHTDSTVSYGENTQSEMCYNFVTYYPRITNKQWVWAAPGYLGKTTTYVTPLEPGHREVAQLRLGGVGEHVAL